jgi:hypothetical protein
MDTLTNLLNVSSLVLTGKKVVSTGFLVGCDEVWIVNGRERLVEIRYMTSYLTLEIPSKDLSTFHRLVHRHGRYIPTTENEVIGMNHRKHIAERNVNVFSSTGV